MDPVMLGGVGIDHAKIEGLAPGGIPGVSLEAGKVRGSAHNIATNQLIPVDPSGGGKHAPKREGVCMTERSSERCAVKSAKERGVSCWATALPKLR